MAVCQSGQPIPDFTFCRRFIESVRMTAREICILLDLGDVCFSFLSPEQAPEHLFGLVVRRPPRERKIPGSNCPACAGIFSGSSHTRDLKLALQWLSCQAPGVIGSVLRLVGPVSEYCDWVRWKVWSATSISV